MTSRDFQEPPSILKTLLKAKAEKKMTFEAIGKAIGRDEVWVASAFYGQAKLTDQDIEKLSAVLEVSSASLKSEVGDNWFPHRGLGPAIPTDPVIYRLYEGVLVYGEAIKAVIHEKFGDGIMSMIDCNISVDRKKAEKGDRVVLTFEGKYLEYSKW
ncbi:Cyanase [Cristinia sonorae]|uniref:Cyanate hydratase n=1 Tax=Cristinia sonorae TaxID=1940300 RepID=A0A8K0XQ30_9AGAR|nr:Cyanase [Cristinia sonorae]